MVRRAHVHRAVAAQGHHQLTAGARDFGLRFFQGRLSHGHAGLRDVDDGRLVLTQNRAFEAYEQAGGKDVLFEGDVALPSGETVDVRTDQLARVQKTRASAP